MYTVSSDIYFNDDWRSNPLKIMQGAPPCDSKAREACNSQKKVHNSRSHVAPPAHRCRRRRSDRESVTEMRNQLMTFPINQAVCSIFMGRCMWAVLHLCKDDDEELLRRKCQHGAGKQHIRQYGAQNVKCHVEFRRATVLRRG